MTSSTSTRQGDRLFADLEQIYLLQVMPPVGVIGWLLIFLHKDVIWSASISILPNSLILPLLRRPMSMIGQCQLYYPLCLQACSREAGVSQKNRSLA